MSANLKSLPKLASKKPKCGTISGYTTHRAKKEKICDDCKNANYLYMREYRIKNKEKIRALSQAWNEKNSEKNIESSRKYRRNNLHKRRMLDIQNKHRRRANKINNGFEIYTEEQVLNLYGTCCHICNEPIDLSAPRSCKQEGWQNGLHLDHVIPMARGGSDTLDNVRPSHGLCNIKKGAK